MNTNLEKQASAARIDKWAADPERSVAAGYAVALLSGQWVSEEGTHGVLSQVVRTFRAAGRTIDEQRVPNANGAKRFRMRGRPRPSKQADVRTIKHERSGETHPALGTQLVVRALALTDDGQLVLQLSNGRSAWRVSVLGHVEG